MHAEISCWPVKSCSKRERRRGEAKVKGVLKSAEERED
jgi:hypothetical protein